MKSFLRFIVISLLPLSIISSVSFLYNGNFEDFENKDVVIYSIFFFATLSIAYVYIFEILLKKIKKVITRLTITSGIIFLVIFVFGLYFPSFEFGTRKLLTSTFQGTLGISIFLLEYLIVNFYLSSGNKKQLLFTDSFLFYLKVIAGVSFFELLLFSVMIIDVFLQAPTLKVFFNYFSPILIFPLLINCSAFTSLKLLSRIQFLKYKSVLVIVISIFLGFLMVSLFNLIRFKYVFHANLLYLILSVFSTMLIYTIVDYRDRFNVSNNDVKLFKKNFYKRNNEYLQLKQQVNPHFLFNNLNTLISFIEINPKKAIEFGQHLSNTYRYYLKQQSEDFVLLNEEISFIKEYLEIYKAKFENGFSFKIDVEATNNQFILSLSLQEIIDNIFKHNILDEQNPIQIDIFILNSNLCISNSVSFNKTVVSSKFGIDNINNRYKLLTQKNIEISILDGVFQVSLPILTLEK